MPCTKEGILVKWELRKLRVTFDGTHPTAVPVGFVEGGRSFLLSGSGSVSGSGSKFDKNLNHNEACIKN